MTTEATTTWNDAPAASRKVRDHLNARWAELASHEHNWSEYTRINGPGPHWCEVCGERTMSAEACFEGYASWSCGCDDEDAQAVTLLLEDVEDSIALYDVAAAFVAIANNPPTFGDSENMAAIIEANEAWRHDQREAGQELNRACVSYAKRHGVAGSPLGQLREAAMNGWLLPSGTRDQDRAFEAVSKAMRPVRAGGAL